MNKKGFTLIELLSSVTIMTLIATIASINIVKIFDTKKEEAKTSEKGILTTAACIYVEMDKNKALKNKCLTSGCEISTDILIKEGLLNESDVDNPEIINIFKENNEKKCIIK